MSRAMKTPFFKRALSRPVSAVAVTLAVFTMANALIAGCGGSKTEESAEGTPTTTTTTTTTETTPAPVAVEMDGAKIYAERCTVCHGVGGKGDGPGGAALNPHPRDHTDGKYMNAKPDAELLATLHNGKGAMPAWKGILTDEQIAAVLAHVRTLAVPAYTAPK